MLIIDLHEREKVDTATTNALQVMLGDGDKFALLRKVYFSAVTNRFPIAVWRSPNSQTSEAVVDMSGEALKTKINFDTLPAGFCFSKFSRGADEHPYFIKADFYLRGVDCWLIEEPENAAYTSKGTRIFENTLRAFDNKKELPLNWFVRACNQPDYTVPGKSEYCRLIEKSIAAIKRYELKKVVLSRLQEVALQENFHPLSLFERLSNAYPTAFVSLVALPGLGTWIGATPELLFRFKEDEITTVALAGTKQINNLQANGNWGEKEIIEQSIVSEFIRDTLSEKGIEHYEESNTESVQIGNLLHLQTQFSLSNISSRPAGTAEAFLDAIHPTPAICGVPQKSALDFIKTEEFHDREFYSGYLGPVNLREETRLFVNLRCLQLQQRSALVYAGGGITIDSDPEKEWLETELKLAALLKFLTTRNESSLKENHTEAA